MSAVAKFYGHAVGGGWDWSSDTIKAALMDYFQAAADIFTDARAFFERRHAELEQDHGVLWASGM